VVHTLTTRLQKVKVLLTFSPTTIFALIGIILEAVQLVTWPVTFLRYITEIQ